jgi:hypothetical protein
LVESDGGAAFGAVNGNAVGDGEIIFTAMYGKKLETPPSDPWPKS